MILCSKPAKVKSTKEGQYSFSAMNGDRERARSQDQHGQCPAEEVLIKKDDCRSLNHVMCDFSLGPQQIKGEEFKVSPLAI